MHVQKQTLLSPYVLYLLCLAVGLRNWECKAIESRLAVPAILRSGHGIAVEIFLGCQLLNFLNYLRLLPDVICQYHLF